MIVVCAFTSRLRSRSSVSPRTFQKNRVLHCALRAHQHKKISREKKKIRARTIAVALHELTQLSPNLFCATSGKLRRRVSAPHLRFYSLPQLIRSRINRGKLYHSLTRRASKMCSATSQRSQSQLEMRIARSYAMCFADALHTVHPCTHRAHRTNRASQ